MAQKWRQDLRTFSAIFFYWKSGSANFFAFRMYVYNIIIYYIYNYYISIRVSLYTIIYTIAIYQSRYCALKDLSLDATNTSSSSSPPSSLSNITEWIYMSPDYWIIFTWPCQRHTDGLRPIFRYLLVLRVRKAFEVNVWWNGKAII